MITIVSLVTVSCVVAFVVSKKVIKNIAQKKAIQRLSALLFPMGLDQKEAILGSIDALTHHRFGRDEIMDYYLKIKGLQAVNLNDPVDFWIRHYLLQPTRIRLNYFEQVKFYETFLNYPEIQGKQEVITIKPQKRINHASIHEYA